jgi:hypothetical protein
MPGGALFKMSCDLPGRDSTTNSHVSENTNAEHMRSKLDQAGERGWGEDGADGHLIEPPPDHRFLSPPCFSTMSEPALSARVRPTDPALIAERAQSNGWHSGQHIDRDKQRRLNHYNPKVLAQQDAVLNTFAVYRPTTLVFLPLTGDSWNWAKTDYKRPFDECKESYLRHGAPIPELHELKDFWRFYKDQSVSKLNERPTARTLRARAKEFKAGFR